MATSNDTALFSKVPSGKKSCGRKRGPFYYTHGTDPKRSRISYRAKPKKKKRGSLSTIQRIKLSRGCESGCCPVTGPYHAGDLVFHHAVGVKLFTISGSKKDNKGFKNNKMRMAEIEKCLVLCHICHSRHHNNDLDLTEVIRQHWPNSIVSEILEAKDGSTQKRLF